MEAFKSYALQEFGRVDYAASEFKFTFNSSSKIDKASARPVINNNISVKISIVDRSMNVLDSKSFKFVNNELSPSCKKKLVNIAPAELTNRFVAALPSIAREIANDLSTRIGELQQQLASLQAYASHNNSIIPSAFRGESVMISDSQILTKTSNSKQFEF